MYILAWPYVQQSATAVSPAAMPAATAALSRPEFPQGVDYKLDWWGETLLRVRDDGHEPKDS